MQRCQRYHLRDPAIARVSLAPQIDQVDIQPQDLRRRSFQVLALLWIALDLVHSLGFDLVALPVTVQEASQRVSEVEPRHPVDAHIDIVTRDAEQLVTDPPSGEA